MRSRTEMSYQNPKNSLAAARLVLKFSSIETRGPVLKHFVMLAAVWWYPLDFTSLCTLSTHA